MHRAFELIGILLFIIGLAMAGSDSEFPVFPIPNVIGVMLMLISCYLLSIAPAVLTGKVRPTIIPRWVPNKAPLYRQ